MNSLTKMMIALCLGAVTYGGTQAAAQYRPDYCPTQHDHRSHDASYYDYYEKDDYYRAEEIADMLAVGAPGEKSPGGFLR